MAKGRKPAIDGLARPQGVLDDVVLPIIQKGARKVQNIAGRHVAKQKGDKAVVAKGMDLARRKVVRAASRVESSAEVRRQLSYMKKEQKNFYKMQDRLPSDNPKAKLSKSAFRYAKKSEVAGNKARAIVESRPVRQVAKRTRKNYR